MFYVIMDTGGIRVVEHTVPANATTLQGPYVVYDDAADDAKYLRSLQSTVPSWDWWPTPGSNWM